MHAKWTKEEVKWNVGLPIGTLHHEALMESLHTHTHEEGDTLSLRYMELKLPLPRVIIGYSNETNKHIKTTLIMD